MDFYMKLPRNKKEFALFLAIVSILSVSIISPIITGFELGFTFDMWQGAMKTAPFIWVTVVIMVLLIHPVADKISEKIVHPKDSFNSQIIVNILCNVLLMSLFMTVFGTWIGMRKIDLAIFSHYFYVWPRNFTISLIVEMLIAQPIARGVLYQLHLKQKVASN